MSGILSALSPNAASALSSNAKKKDARKEEGHPSSRSTRRFCCLSLLYLVTGILGQFLLSSRRPACREESHMAKIVKVNVEVLESMRA